MQSSALLKTNGKIADNTGIKQIDSNIWQVPSQTGNGTYDVKNVGGVFTCTCPDYQFRGFKVGKCKHISILKYHFASLQKCESDGKDNSESSDTVRCKDCNSPRVIKYGKTGKRVIKQIYNCKEAKCGRYFVPEDAFTKMKNDPKIICLAILMHCRGVSLRGISETLQDTSQLKVSHQTILNWIDKYSKLLTEFIRTLTPDFSGQINADELYVFIRGDLFYWFNAIDPETRYLLASVISEKKDIEGARAVFEEAKKTIKDQRLLKVVTDGLGAYKRAYKKVFWSNDKRYREHEVAIRLTGNINNNIMERLNNTIRDREKVTRRIKSPHSPIFKMYPIFYNFLRKHQSLELTPAQAAGNGFDLGSNKLLGLIEKAYEMQNTGIEENKERGKIDSYFEKTEDVTDQVATVPNPLNDQMQTYHETGNVATPPDNSSIDLIGETKQSRRIKNGWKEKGWL